VGLYGMEDSTEKLYLSRTSILYPTMEKVGFEKREGGSEGKVLTPTTRRAYTLPPQANPSAPCCRRTTACRPVAILHPAISPQMLSFWKPHMGHETLACPHGPRLSPLCQGLAFHQKVSWCIPWALPSSAWLFP